MNDQSVEKFVMLRIICPHGFHVGCHCPECGDLAAATTTAAPAASKPPATTVTQGNSCKHCGIYWHFHDSASVLCSNLQVARSEIDRLKAEVAELTKQLALERVGSGDE